MEQFKEMFEASYQQKQLPEPGSIIKTTVIQVTDKEVILDIGAKSESSLSLTEFENRPNVGDQIEVYVESAGHNYIKVSLKKALEKKAFLKVRDAAEMNLDVQGKIIEEVKGGFKVLLEGSVTAFLPISQVELKKVDHPEKYKNRVFTFKILQFENKGRNLNVVVSRIPILENMRAQKIQEMMSSLKEGAEITGKVVKINPKSVIVDIDKLLTGIIRIGDLSWDHIDNPHSVVREGQRIKAKILSIHKEKNELLLSLKHMKNDPWVEFAVSHQTGDTVSGTVTKIFRKDVFVRISEGVEGIIRFNDLSWSKSIKRPEEVVKKGDKLELKIVEINKEKRKLYLSLKQVFGDPWENIEEKYPKGKKVKGKIIDKKDFGVFVEIETGVEALLHKNDIDWNLKKIDLEQYKIGDEIEGIVLSLNKKERKIGLGIKQLFDNPWQNFASEYPKNSIVKGKIKEIKENELIIDYGNEIEGILHKRDLDKKVENLKETYQIGQEIEAMVIEIQPSKNFLKVSEREMLRREREKEVAKYMNKTEEEQKLGNFLGQNLDNLKNRLLKNKKEEKTEEKKVLPEENKVEENKETKEQS